MRLAFVFGRWMGGRMPLSNALAQAIRRTLQGVTEGEGCLDEDLKPVRALLAEQQSSSRLPCADELLIERIRTRDGDHAFLFPIAGRLVHEGLGTLLAYRITRRKKATIATTCNDWGLSLVCPKDLPVEDEQWAELLSPENLLEDLLASLDAAGLTRRHFREVARVAGLVSSGPPHRRKQRRQLQASAGLVFDVLQTHDPDNLLLSQARREVLERSLEVKRLRLTLEELEQRRLRLQRPRQLTPFAFPLWADRIRERVSSESWQDRVQAMVQRLEQNASRRTRSQARG